MCHNIEIDNDGNLWIGSHPKIQSFTRHAKDKINLSPSQVLRVSLDSSNQYSFDEIYLNAGEELSGSSVGAIYKNNLLIFHFSFPPKKQSVENYKLIDSSYTRRSKIFLLVV